jgi:tetratricopeptide (TPR) repeat protein
MSRVHTFALFCVAVAGCQGPIRETATNEDRPPPPATEPAHEMGPPQTVSQWADGARLFDKLGDFHRSATTRSPEAQKYFDQGMRLLWAFNHDESTRSFAQAARLDPACAICYWGVALTVGPNYNVPVMAEPRAKVAWEALQLAQKNAASGTAVEQALIGALGKRYKGVQALDPSNEGPVLADYANAMREVARQFPGDVDVQVLFAESLMNINAWKLWGADGKPAPGTTEIVATLEGVLKRDPAHPGANHYYVHAVEASPHPENAVAAAERLGGMMPGAGHLVHMPAHIMQRVGRYEDAAQANRKGAEADKAYLAQTKPLDYYGMYVAHNYQFLAYSAAMEGRKAEALAAARKTLESIPDEMLGMMPGMDWCVSETYPVMLRFGMWDELLAEPAPSPAFKARMGAYLYTRTAALAAKGRIAEAKVAAAALEKLNAEVPADYGACLNTARDVLAVAGLIAKASIARAEGRAAESIALLREAVAKEDRLAYDEPADWFFPVRHLLGAELLKAGKAKDAESVYRADLKRNPGNGWALFGLAQALRAQKKESTARRIDADFQKAWKNADVALQASSF